MPRGRHTRLAIVISVTTRGRPRRVRVVSPWEPVDASSGPQRWRPSSCCWASWRDGRSTPALPVARCSATSSSRAPTSAVWDPTGCSIRSRASTPRWSTGRSASSPPRSPTRRPPARSDSRSTRSRRPRPRWARVAPRSSPFDRSAGWRASSDPTTRPSTTPSTARWHERRSGASRATRCSHRPSPPSNPGTGMPSSPSPGRPVWGSIPTRSPWPSQRQPRTPHSGSPSRCPSARPISRRDSPTPSRRRRRPAPTP